MDKNKIIRIVCAVGSAISVFFITRFLGFLVIGNTLGNTSYALSAPLMLPLEILAALAAVWLYIPRTAHEEEYVEDEYIEELEEVYEAEPTSLPELDESAYPELFKSKDTESESVSFNRPDISRLIREQGGEVKKPDEPQEKEDILGKIEAEKSFDYSLYEDIPTELPEDYVPYEYEEEAEEAEDYEEYEIPKIPPLAIKLPALFIASLLAIFLPINAATVYSPDTITVRRPFMAKEYAITDAEYYTVGVKLSGDVSMKLHFKDGHEQELVFPTALIESKSFKSSFSSEYGYAAFCNRLLKRSEVEKRFEELTSLSPSSALSEKDLAYIEEITETNINNN